MTFPRRDQLIRQLSRVGLRAQQLTSPKLVKLFYEIYNQGGNNLTPTIQQPIIEPVRLGTPQLQRAQQTPNFRTPPPAGGPVPSEIPIQQVRGARNHPFVVEELT